MAASLVSFLDHTKWHNTVSRTPLDEGSARCRDVYLTIHNTHKRKTSMPPAGFSLFSCILFPSSLLVSVLIVLHFAFLSALTTHNTNIHFPGGIFCSLSVPYPYFFVLIVLAFAFSSNWTTTQYKHPCPRQDSNPQPQQAIGRRPSP